MVSTTEYQHILDVELILVICAAARFDQVCFQVAYGRDPA
jgi:hypothetical protein